MDQRRYRKVFVRLWSNNQFRALSEGERLFGIYLLTGPQTNRVGLYKLSVGAAAEDLAISAPAAQKRLKSVCAAFGWEFDAAARVLWIPSWWHFNTPTENPKNFTGALTDLAELPQTPLIARFRSNRADIPAPLHRLLDGDTVTDPIGDAISDTDTARSQEQEQEQEQETKRGASRFPDNPTRAQLRSMGTLVAPVVDAHVYRRGPIDVTHKTHAALREKASVRLGTEDTAAIDSFLGEFYAATEAEWRRVQDLPDDGKPWEIWLRAYAKAFPSSKGGPAFRCTHQHPPPNDCRDDAACTARYLIAQRGAPVAS